MIRKHCLLSVGAVLLLDGGLVDAVEDVGSIDENPNRPSDRDRHEDEELQAVEHLRDVAPVVHDLRK